MARERTDLTPSLVGSVLLHGALALAALISWHFGKEVHIPASVPVTIVANAPETNVRPAVEAPVEQDALTETPEPDATPEPPAPPTPEPPAPQPKPSPPKPAPKPAEPVKPTPAPKKVTPTPAKPAKPAAKQPALDLDALANSLKPAKAKPKSSAAKGRSRYETAIKARTAAGAATGVAAAALGELSADLARRWNPNCEVEGGADVNIDVAFRLNQAGRVIGTVQAQGENSSNSVVRVAAERAKRAVHEAEPFDNLPPELYGDRIIVRFNARTACASG